MKNDGWTPFLGGQGPETGGPVNSMYSNWNNNPSEPNQAGNEDHAHITDDSIGLIGSWNDLTNTELAVDISTKRLCCGIRRNAR